jgi:NAD(P)-dependent dehydrogenase (short-subunit alcohol dehydrogenase family)
MLNHIRKGVKMTLKGKVALITGAGAGIGRAIAVRFARHGAKVVVDDINRLGGESTVKIIRGDGGEATFVLANVSKSTEAERMVKFTIQTYGRLDILVNNAGVWFGKPLAETPEQEWDELMNINLKGVFLCSKYAIPEMRARNGGVIINLSSIAALAGTAQCTAYCASKGGVLLLTKALALELKPFNIRVNALCPAMINTNMGQQVIKTGIVSEQAEMGKPEDVANAALFLASDDSAFITGHGLVVGEAATY